MSSSGKRRRRPRTMSPSKFSSLASLITEQPLRLGSGQQDLAEVTLGPLDRLDFPPRLLGRRVARPQVILERGWIGQVATDDRVHVGELERVVGQHDRLGGGA